MQDLEYLIQLLKFCEKELTKVVPGCNPLEGADYYALKCTKITLFIKTHKNTLILANSVIFVHFNA